MFLGEKTIGRLGCFGCHTIPGFENAKPIGTPLNDWGIKSPAKLDYGHIAEYLDDQTADERRRPRRHRPATTRRSSSEHTRIGLPLPEAAPAAELRLPEDEREPQGLGRPPADAPVRLGQRPGGRRGGHDLRPRPDRREDRQPGTCPRRTTRRRQTAVAQGAKVLNRYNCTGCHVLEMPKYTIAAGTKVAEAFTDFKTNVRVVVHRPGDRLPPGVLPRADLRPQEEARRRHRAELGPEPRRRSPIEGMPIGLFENELTVQLWKPVTIRGLHVQRRRQRDARPDQGPEDRRRRAATSPGSTRPTEAERTGGELRDLLEPPAAAAGPRGEQGADALADRPSSRIRTRSARRSTCGCRGSTTARPTTRAARETDGAGQLLRGPRRRRVPLPGDPRARAGLPGRARGEAPRLPRGGLDDDDEQGVAVHPVPRDRPVQADRRRAGGQRSRPAAGRRPVPARLPRTSGSPTRAGWSPTRRCRRTSRRTGRRQIPVPKTFENQPIEMVRAIRDTLLNYINVVEQQLAGAKPAAEAAAGARAATPADRSSREAPERPAEMTRLSGRRTVESDRRDGTTAIGSTVDRGRPVGLGPEPIGETRRPTHQERSR